ncbi:VWA domain-containing protein [Chlamydiales bacterium]|nr:VWA domain-containing protein [Chlamydiales bacterium]
MEAPIATVIFAISLRFYENGSLSFQGWGWVFSLFFLATIYLFRKFLGPPKEPTLPFSSIQYLGENQAHSVFKKLAFLKFVLILFMALALANPEWITKDFDKIQRTDEMSQLLPKKGIALYLVLDRSGSMDREVFTEKQGYIPLIDLLKKVTKTFVTGSNKERLSGRPDDLMGLIAFARTPQVVVPLTFEHGDIVRGIDQIETAKKDDENETAIGYAIYKTAHLIGSIDRYAAEQEGYQIRHNAIILITDGLQTTHPLDIGRKYRSISLDDAANYAKSVDTKLYIINLFPDLNEERFSPERRQMQRVSQMTGGRFFSLKDPEGLSHVLREIDQIEKSAFTIKGQLVPGDFVIRTPLYPYFLWGALVLFTLFLFLDYGYWLRFP